MRILGVGILIALIIIVASAVFYEYAIKHSAQAHLNFSATKEIVPCSDATTNPGFNFQITLTNPESVPVYWSVSYVPRSPTAATHNSLHDRVRVALPGGMLIAGQNTIPAQGQTTLDVLGYVDEAWNINFAYSSDKGAVTFQTMTFNLVCG